jgi:multiple sugar transport system substrate-binding protein
MNWFSAHLQTLDFNEKGQDMNASLKKIPISLLLLLCLCASFLASCQSSANTGNQEVTLTIQHGWSKSTPVGQLFQNLLDQFHKANPSISFKQTIVTGTDDTQKYETAVLAGEEPDIVLLNLVSDTLNWLQQGATVDVTQYLKDWGLESRILPQAVQQWTNSKGQVQGFPFDGFKWPVWYNTALLQKAGVTQPPATIDELLDATKKLRAIGSAPITIGGSDWTGNKLFFQVMESYLTDDQIKPLFQNGNYCSNPNAVKGIDLFLKLRDAGVFVDSAAGLNSDQMTSLFNTQKAAIMSSGSWAISATPTELTSNIYLSGLPIPADSVQQKPTAYQGYTSTGIWISPNGVKQIEAVRKFVQFMYQPSTISQFIEKASMTPAVQTDASALKNTNSLLQQATSQLDSRVSYVLLPDLYVPGSVLNKLQNATSQAFIAGKTTSQICSALQTAYK